MPLSSFIPDYTSRIPETLIKEVPQSFLRFDLSVVKYSPSPRVIKALKDYLDKVNFYPPGNWEALTRKIGQVNHVSKENVLLTNGLDEAIDLITRTFVEPNEKVLISTPTFSQYEVAALRQRAKPRKISFLNKNGFFIDEDVLIRRAAEGKVKVIWICNPNNPTGPLTPRKSILEIFRGADCLVAVDECYYEFCGETVADLIEKYKNLIVLRSFSKSYSLAGLRIGYIIANREIIKVLSKMRQPASVNLLAQIAALNALQDPKYYEEIRREIVREREKLTASLRDLGLKVFDSKTNFVLVKTSEAKKLFKELWKGRIAVLPGWNPEFSDLGENYLRITVGLPEENTTLLNTLNNIIKNVAVTKRNPA